MTDIVKVVNEVESIPEAVSSIATLTFELYEQLYIGGAKISTSNFELIADEKDNNYLKGFKNTIDNVDEEKIKQAEAMAGRFVNYLSVKTGSAVRHKRPMISRTTTSGNQSTVSTAVNVVLVKNFDLDMAKIQQSVLDTNDSYLPMRLGNYNQGIAKLFDCDFAAAIHYFYLVIESADTLLAPNGKDLAKTYYLPLRHAVNHDKLDGKDTVDALQNEFKLNLKRGTPPNLHDPDNQNRLKHYATELKEVVTKYLNGELKGLSV